MKITKDILRQQSALRRVRPDRWLACALWSQFAHVDVSDLQEVAEDAASVEIMPFRQSFVGFSKELPALRGRLSQGKEAQHLEPVIKGRLLESGTVAAGQMELQRRRRDLRARNLENYSGCLHLVFVLREDAF